eukprot:CAMPEP_0194763830 /NCGR_PEP_ID=MMETSP0323_2-20130528/20604_1 /TAXON_ID=2866 ORGANISM="Crypthecodinium cohnii, Strain Seligo" /NCGR_SAMPLE_ID=MMETSP0323_2 /ASSEMBLY_ACC=CAM_ASM_000346 /LENGTH=38 /DNA_ID= /DNA_START= /DNA_END= /DNA_ORIENTATION=
MAAASGKCLRASMQMQMQMHGLYGRGQSGLLLELPDMA